MGPRFTMAGGHFVLFLADRQRWYFQLLVAATLVARLKLVALFCHGTVTSFFKWRPARTGARHRLSYHGGCNKAFLYLTA